MRGSNHGNLPTYFKVVFSAAPLGAEAEVMHIRNHAAQLLHLLKLVHALKAIQQALLDPCGRMCRTNM
jgi:hypothetical protein